MAPTHLNFATLSVGNMFETLRSTGKLTGVRYVLVLEVELYIYFHQNLNAKVGVGACHVPETAKRCGGLL